MKLGKLILAFLTLAVLLPAGAFAGNAAGFKGVYPIISETEKTSFLPPRQRHARSDLEQVCGRPAAR